MTDAITALRAIAATLAATPWLALLLVALTLIVLADCIRVYRQEHAGREGGEGERGFHNSGDTH